MVRFPMAFLMWAGWGAKPHVVPPPPTPTITLQPLDAAAYVDGYAEFECDAINYDSLLWETSTDDGDTWLPTSGWDGLTTTKISIDSLPEDQDGNLYRCTFTNTSGSTSTRAALLTEVVAPDFNQEDFKPGDFA